MTLRSLTTEATSEGQVLGLDSDTCRKTLDDEGMVDENRLTLCVDSSQVGVFEQGDKISLSRLLESHDGRRLEAKIGL